MRETDIRRVHYHRVTQVISHTRIGYDERRILGQRFGGYPCIHLAAKDMNLTKRTTLYLLNHAFRPEVNHRYISRVGRDIQFPVLLAGYHITVHVTYQAVILHQIAVDEHMFSLAVYGRLCRQCPHIRMVQHRMRNIHIRLEIGVGKERIERHPSRHLTYYR